MRYKKISPVNNKWTKTCQALKELFETLQCSKCKNSLHDSKQFLQCGHFSCYSCIKSSKKCTECHYSVNEDVLKDESIKKIVQACCIIAEEVGFRVPNNVGTISKESPIREQTNGSTSGQNSLDSNNGSSQSKEKPKNVMAKRKGVEMVTGIDEKKLKLEKTVPTIRIPKNIEKKNHHGETKLQAECKKNHRENVKILLDSGANPNTCCAAGWTPLQECADFGFIDIAELLLGKGADINKKGYEGRTPLHEAIKANQLAMVKFLLNHNAQKEITDEHYNRPIDYCKTEEIRMLMCKNGSRSSCTSKGTRDTSVPLNEMSNTKSPGINRNDSQDSQNISATNNFKNEECHNISATNNIKIDECDISDSDNEDNVIPSRERCSQNITIVHEEIAWETSGEVVDTIYDTEEIDILN